MNNQKIHFISYGNERFTHSLVRIKSEAEQTTWFDTVTTYKPQDLSPEFVNKYSNILKLPRLGGYGIWKVDIIQQKLNEINDGDILVYCDAGCKINFDGKPRFFEYITLLNNSDKCTISFNLPFLEKCWTVKQIFNYFNTTTDGEFANSFQSVSCLIIMKKNKELQQILDEYKQLLDHDPLLITDHYNSGQETFFTENRHDQSIWSMLRKMHDTINLGDETWFEPFGNDESLKYPFWAMRIRK